MADEVNVRDESKYQPHPEGVKVGQCVDAIDLGECVIEFTGNTPYVGRKVALVFRTGALNTNTSEPIDQAQEFTASMSEKGNLRKFLQGWRGKPYTDEQAKAGVPLHKLVGQYALLTIAHKQSGRGRTYGTIMSVSGVPEEMKASLPKFAEYTRAKYWEERKATYATGVAAFRAKLATVTDDRDFHAAFHDQDDDDDLPF